MEIPDNISHVYAGVPDKDQEMERVMVMEELWHIYSGGMDPFPDTESECEIIQFTQRGYTK